MKLDLPDEFKQLGIPEEDWESTPASIKKLIVLLHARIAELEEQLRTNSSNSSKPPSSDGEEDREARKKRKREKKRKKRKRGAQPGHEGKTRELIPPEEVDRTIECRVTECEYCGNGDVEIEDGDFIRHQVFEMPVIRPIVIEYRQYRYWCDDCGEWHTTMLPLEAGKGMLGPRFQAMVGLLASKYHMSNRGIEEYLEDAFGLKVSLGTVSNTEARVSEALEEPVEELKDHVKDQPVVGADETGWKQAGKKAWMWVATTATACVFLIRESRGGEVAKELLGELFSGILVSDRWGGYNWVDQTRRQLCMAHLDRDFFKISERKGRAGSIGTRLLEQMDKMWEYWAKIRDGTLSRAEFQRKMKTVRTKVEGLLEAGTECGHKKTEGTCEKILKYREALWTFVDVEGVDPTNNASERAVRPGMLWRKNCFGTQSERGSVFVERMMTITATCRLQGRNVLDYLTEAIEAHTMCFPAPSLLPEQMEECDAQAA